MKRSIQTTLIPIAICILGASVLSSCYTVKGAFQGAGKDVSVLVGQDNGSQHTHKTTTKSSSTTVASVKKTSFTPTASSDVIPARSNTVVTPATSAPSTPSLSPPGTGQ